MKTYNLIIVCFLILVLNASLILADCNIASCSVTDDEFNESVSSLGIGLKQASIWFTFNQEKKAEKELELARLRLIQARIAAKNGNEKVMIKALEAHQNILDRVKERLQKDKEIKDNLKLSAGEIVSLQKAIEVHEARIDKLNQLLADENLTEEQKLAIEAKIEQMKEVTNQLLDIQEAKREKVKDRLMKENMSEKEVEELLENIDDSKNLSEFRMVAAEIRIQQVESTLAKMQERAKEDKANKLNVTILNNQITVLNATLSQAKEYFEHGQYTSAIEILRPVRNYGLNNKEVIEQERVDKLIKEAKDKRKTVREIIRQERGI